MSGESTTSYLPVQEELARFRAALDCSADAIYLIDRRTMRFIDFNQAAMNDLGYSRQELLQLGPHDIKPDFDEQQLAARFDKVISTAELAGVIETIQQRKDGSLFPVEVNLRALEGDQSHVLIASVRDLTERKKAEENLQRTQAELERRSRQQLRDHEALAQAILDTAVDAIINIDEAGTILLFNRAAEKMFGYASGEVLGQNVSILMPSPYREEHDGHLAQYLQSGQKHIIGISREAVGLRRNGEVFPIELAVSAVEQTGRGIFTGVVRDNSQRKRDEAALRESEQRFVDIIHSSKTPILLLDGDTIHDCNEAAASMLKHAGAEQLRGKLPAELSPATQPDGQSSKAKAREIIELTIEKGGHRFEWTHLQADGESILIEVTLIPIPLHGKQVLYATWKDISELRRAEEQIRSLARFPTENPNPIARFSCTGEILYGNNAATPMLEYWQQGCDDSSMQSMRKIIEDVFLSQEKRREIVSCGQHWYELLLVPFWDSQYVTMYGRDITDARIAESQLRLAKEQAEAANIAKSQFLANMSHEIRTPLNAILGFTDLLREGDVEPDEHQEFLETIHASGQHLLALINDILDISKIESGHLEIEMVACQPGEIVDEIVSIMSARARSKGIHLAAAGEGELPDSIETDPRMLRQVLINLVGNAVKFTPHGEVRILTRWLPEDELYEFQVHDTGIGIAQEKLNSIFAPFVQADNSVTREYGGTGLGLAICSRIAHALGGDLKVASQKGVGSTFTLTIKAPLTADARMITRTVRSRQADGEPAGLGNHREDIPV